MFVCHKKWLVSDSLLYLCENCGRKRKFQINSLRDPLPRPQLWVSYDAGQGRERHPRRNALIALLWKCPIDRPTGREREGPAEEEGGETMPLLPGPSLILLFSGVISATSLPHTLGNVSWRHKNPRSPSNNRGRGLSSISRPRTHVFKLGLRSYCPARLGP